MRRRPEQPARKQLTPNELLSKCLALLHRKFYQGKTEHSPKTPAVNELGGSIASARRLDERGVTISSDKYNKIFMSVFIDSLRYGDLEKISYLAAWLAKVIQRHFDHHGEEIYQKAKFVCTLTEIAPLFAKKNAAPVAYDPVSEFAQAHRLIRPKGRPSVKDKEQLRLL
jgi:hypothetical protein